MDELDRNIIGLLSADARVSVATLSRRLKVARSTIQARLERLETSGVGTSSSQVTIKDWAMQTIPGMPIVTGVIPEPAIVWLLLIGLGLAAGRRMVRR